MGERVLFRPFVEAGLGSDGGDIEVLYGAGVRGHIVQPIERLHLTLGGAAIRKESGHDRARLRRLLDFRGRSGGSGSLGLSIGRKSARGGGYTIARRFDGLEIRREGEPLVVLRQGFEVGGSFITAPDFRVQKITLPWIALGYQFGEVVSGVRI